MATPKPPVQPMSDGLHAAMSKAFFRVKAHSKKFGVAKTGFSKNRVFRYPIKRSQEGGNRVFHKNPRMAVPDIGPLCFVSFHHELRTPTPEVYLFFLLLACQSFLGLLLQGKGTPKLRPLDQLQVGNGPETGNGRRMAGEMAGGHFSGRAQNGRKNGQPNGRTGKKMAATQPFARPFFGHFGALPEKWPPAISPAIFRPFPVSSPFPSCSWSMGSQRQNPNLVNPLFSKKACRESRGVGGGSDFGGYHDVLTGFPPKP